ncbi:MAG: recombination protein RecR [Ignavibacteria bacterium CG_4_8_14_3_um_filter_37_9]|nr:recombination protein RecR [Ignavibacteria bacterium]OIO13904.1 MAG: recombination protein RecR [Ignavibacteria bacterium CG1_02_37_35]PIP79758.1 MAG: recombination protein RecR [Ignavibacteria bacterium CG22_combo_CG10-13_8_21_14_all_37_15]PIS45466.1 MAG: recombination protein RecR [Ignavibacteria bacterium CG08_land_8_20_14_0_20_37_9]PIX00128.1 MAG: recombination protein RecR [Ignavibacteria bacterium CG_4_8_14_3_um_filter_37_9]PIX94503.1 MAG: recombination protein RecR [Ignavibacteria ba
MNISEPLQIAIEEFSKFPGIGKKTAQRLSLYLLKKPNDEVEKFINAIYNLKHKLKFCSICFSITEFDVCEICSSPKRDNSVLCIVEEPGDIIAIERTNEYNGVYHVLSGVLSPLSGIGPESLKINELLKRLKTQEVSEIILALNPDTEGDATSLYLGKLLQPLNIKVTRIARGLPIGGDLEFADEATIARAVSNRGLL